MGHAMLLIDEENKIFLIYLRIAKTYFLYDFFNAVKDESKQEMLAKQYIFSSKSFQCPLGTN